MSPLKHKLLLICFLISTKAFAVAPNFDANTPIQIQSDAASYDQRNQEAMHEGKVVMTQGTQLLYADKLTVKKDPKQQTIIKAFGNPASFSGSFKDDPKPVYATAKIIYYYPDRQLIVLEGAATLDHDQDKFKGPSLSYQIDKQIVSATRQSNERPVITIHPRVSKNESTQSAKK